MRASVNVWKEVLDGLKGMGGLEELDMAGRERVVAGVTQFALKFPREKTL